MASEKIPVYLSLGQHSGNDENSPALQNLRAGFESALETTVGKVAVLMEYANHSREAGLEIQQKVEDGMLPSQAIIENMQVYAKKRLSPTRYRRAASLNFADGFYRGYRNILDGVSLTYPGRMLLVPEWEPEDEIVQDDRSGIVSGLPGLLRLIESEKREEALVFYKNWVKLAGEKSRAREARIAATLNETAQERDDITAAVGFFGSAHTGLSKELRALGFDPKRKLDEKFSFAPFSFIALARYVRFYSFAEVPESHWEIAFNELEKSYWARRSNRKGLPPPTA